MGLYNSTCFLKMHMKSDNKSYITYRVIKCEIISPKRYELKMKLHVYPWKMYWLVRKRKKYVHVHVLANTFDLRLFYISFK